MLELKIKLFVLWTYFQNLDLKFFIVFSVSFVSLWFIYHKDTEGTEVLIPGFYRGIGFCFCVFDYG